MNKDELLGLWILTNRKDNEAATDSSFTIFDKKYEIVMPEMEILFFIEQNNACYHIGITERTEEERKEYDYNTLYDNTSFLPGTFDHENGTVKILEEGKFEILPNGKLYIVEKNDDYFCEEIWCRLSNDKMELRNFVNLLMKDLNHS